MPTAPRKPEEVADILHSATIHLLRRAREYDHELGVGPARLSALSVVVFGGPITLGRLAEAEGVRSATMTGIVKGLEESGLVRRRPHGSDRRAVLLEATEAGKRTLAAGRGRRIETVADRLGDLSADELETLWRAGHLLEDRFALRPWRPLAETGGD